MQIIKQRFSNFHLHPSHSLKHRLLGPLPPELRSEGLVCGLETSNKFPVDATAANLGAYFENLRVKIFQAYLFRNSAINMP